MRSSLLTVAALAATLTASAVHAQSPKRETRAVWIATVSNLDWPSKGASASSQMQALSTMLDGLKVQGINTVYFQVRTECDALYRSSMDPWSQFLTGTQGQDPGYDPLAYAVDEAHKRGMELHAWLNPYRADASVNTSRDDIAANHVMKTHPDWVMNIPRLTTKKVLDPGIPAVRNYVIDVVGEIVTNYDVDGIHFDDYFYPYPDGSFTGMQQEDINTWRTYGAPAGFSLSVFRQYSVNMMVKGVQTKINAIRPSVKFGISPFGIWKSGTPTGTSGMSGADVIYADAVAWMGQGWLDYLTPQLYWVFNGNQDYAKLAPWWYTKMTPTVSTVPMPTTARHFIPGLITTTGQNKEQIAFDRTNGYQGQSIFRAGTLLAAPAFHLDTLYRRPAVPVVMPWKGDTEAPNAPVLLPTTSSGGRTTVSWTKPLPAADGDTARWYGIYRFPQGIAVDLSTNRYLVTVVGGGRTSYVDTPPASEGTTFTYLATAFDESWNESAASLPVVGTDVVGADAPGSSPMLNVVGANPVGRGEAARFRMTLPQGAAVRVGVYDVLGRQLAVLADGAQAAGVRELTWRAPTAGLYVVRMTGDVEAATVLRVR
ncbi:MAG: family 10 glycosylhydrolase [Rhodothermales bacterium]|nr:family 10 glycosylhydrolase [Rhodothermales bacterium]